QWGSVWNFSLPPYTGRCPPALRRKIRVSRWPEGRLLSRRPCRKAPRKRSHQQRWPKIGGLLPKNTPRGYWWPCTGTFGHDRLLTKRCRGVPDKTDKIGRAGRGKERCPKIRSLLPSGTEIVGGAPRRGRGARRVGLSGHGSRRLSYRRLERQNRAARTARLWL